MVFLLATRNQGKLRELQALLGDLDIELVTLEAFPDIPDAEESAADFLGNARRKALHYYSWTGLPTIADDSGLTINALGGWPGVKSARVGPDDASRIRAVLEALAGSGRQTDRRAAFVCAVCAVLADGELIEVAERVDGLIIEGPRGEGGFGYDPIFLYPPAGKTFAEMTEEEKNAVSHRGKALRSIKQQLDAHLSKVES